MSIRRWFISAWCLGAGLVACRDAVGPPSDAVSFAAPVRYRTWWALTEACSGVTGDFDAVRWYVLPAGSSFPLEGQSVNAAWFGDGNKIVFGAGQQFASDLVRHEMLHALLRSGDHPRGQFLDQCGDIVSCVERCVQDAGGPPDTSTTAPLVAVTTLAISTLLAPNPVSLSADSGWLPITVSVTNRTTRAVRVEISPPMPQGDAGISFAFLITPVAGRPIVGASSAQGNDFFVAFAPAGTAGATRRFVFDEGQTLNAVPGPGEYDVTGMFLTASSAPALLHVTQ